LKELAGLWVNKSQLSGMQGESRTATGIVQAGSTEGTSILDVAADGMSEFREMDADLVRAARFQPTFQFAAVANPPQELDMCDRLLANVLVRRAASQSIASITNQMRPNGLVR